MDLNSLNKNKCIIMTFLAVASILLSFTILIFTFNSFENNGLKVKDVAKTYYSNNKEDFQIVTDTLLKYNEYFSFSNIEEMLNSNILSEEDKSILKKPMKKMFKNMDLASIYTSKTYEDNVLLSDNYTTMVFALKGESYTNYENTTDINTSRVVNGQGIVYMTDSYNFANYQSLLSDNFYFYESSSY